MGVIASQTTSLTIVYSTVYSDADQRKHQSTASLAFVLGTGEFPAQMASNVENVSIWWRHHVNAFYWMKIIVHWLKFNLIQYYIWVVNKFIAY